MPIDWKRALREGAIAGSCASVLSTLALLWAGRRQARAAITPGFEHHLGHGALAGVYLAFGAGLARGPCSCSAPGAPDTSLAARHARVPWYGKPRSRHGDAASYGGMPAAPTCAGRRRPSDSARVFPVFPLSDKAKESAMPRAAWSDKRERQYEHIKDSVKQRGRSQKTAEQIAARTVNKERAQHGEAKKANPKTVHDTPAPVRGGQRSHTGAQGRTREQLYEEARKKNIAGRSKMNKAELEKAVGR